MAPLQGFLSLVGRVLLCTIFLSSALGHDIPKFDEVVQVMSTAGIPQPHILLVGAIVFLVAGSLLVILGIFARFGAFLLLAFLVPATYYFHDFWNKTDPGEQQQQMIHFMKNLGLAGAMIFIIANGAGAWSFDAARSCARHRSPAGTPPSA